MKEILELKKLNKILIEDLDKLEFVYSLKNEKEDFRFILKLSDESRILKEEYILDKIENCLLKIKNLIKNNDIREKFEKEINNDIWYSGFKNDDNERLSCFESNIVLFDFKYN